MLRRPLRVGDAALLAAFAAIVVGLPALANGFAYDDVWIVVRNPAVQHPTSVRALLTAPYWPPTDGMGALWRPLTLTGFAAQWVVGGGAPIVFHGVSLALGAAAAALVAIIGGALFGPVVALTAGLLFAVHPVHVEVTATVVGQAELLAAIAYLGAVAAAWRASAGGVSGWWTAAVAVAMLAGLGAKEHVITLPVLLLPLWWWRAARDRRSFVAVARSQAGTLLATLVAALGYLVLRRAILGDAASAGGIATGLAPDSALQRAVVMLPLSLRWLELLFVPWRLSADYSPAHVMPDPSFGALHAVALATWVGLAVVAWRIRRRIPAAAFGTAFFGVTVAIVSNIPVPLEVLLAERLLFLPSVGWAVAVAGGVGWAVGVASARRVVVGVTVVAVAAFGIRSAVRAPVWRSNEALFAQMLREAPRSYRTHWALGAEAFAAGDSVAGEREWREAVRLNPDHPQVLEDLGRLYARTGRWEPAIPLLERAVQLDSARLGAAMALATALGRTGRATDALEVLADMDTRHDGGADLWALRSDLLRRSGDDTAAFAAARAALARDSASWPLWVFAMEAATRIGACDEAGILAAGARRHAGTADGAVVEQALEGAANRHGSCK